MKKWIRLIIYSTIGVVIFGLLAYLVLAFIPSTGQQATTPSSTLSPVNSTGQQNASLGSNQTPGRSMMNAMMGSQSK